MENLKKYDVYVGILPKCQLQNIVSTDISCPLGQLVIASYAKERIRGLKANVFYGEKDTDEETLSKIREYQEKGKTVLVGITLNSGNVKNAFLLMEKLHEIGIDVILGGPEAWMCWCMWKELEIGINIMEAHPYIQGLVLGAGERVITEILKGSPFNGIPNLVYKDKNGEIHENVTDASWQELDFENISVDYDILSKLDEYKGVTYLWSNDCHQARSEKGRCYFCGRINLGNKFRKPEKVWRELEHLYKKGIRSFYNSVDAIVNASEFKRFVAQKPKHMSGDRHKIFINAHQVKEEIIPYLKKLNAVVSIGIESYALYDKVEKQPTTLRDNYNALSLLKKHNIKAILSFVIGLPGESKNSLEVNKICLRQLIKEYGDVIEMLEVSPLTVTMGSKAFKNLMKIAKSKYREKEWPFDITEMMEDYFHYKCDHIERPNILEFIHEIHEMSACLNPNIQFDVKGITPEEKAIIHESLRGLA